MRWNIVQSKIAICYSHISGMQHPCPGLLSPLSKTPECLHSLQFECRLSVRSGASPQWQCFKILLRCLQNPLFWEENESVVHLSEGQKQQRATPVGAMYISLS